MSDERYKVTNTTVKPPRPNAQGKDTRTAVEKVGHLVKFVEGQHERILLPGQARIVADLDDGLRGLEHGGFVRIEKYSSTAKSLKDHVYQSQVDKQVVRETIKKDNSGGSRAKAVEMGQDTYQQKTGQEYEGAVNPDGDPNFLVRAKRDENASEQGNNQADGEGQEVSPTVP